MQPKENETERSQRWRLGKWEKAKELRACTWNVLIFYRTGALKMLKEQLKEYNADITAIQEVKWTGTGVLEEKVCTELYSCSHSKYQYERGFIDKKVKHLVIKVIPVNERV
jgi:mRNA deadenylase 3'-5' endonuclease subunit Ccr4